MENDGSVEFLSTHNDAYINPNNSNAILLEYNPALYNNQDQFVRPAATVSNVELPDAPYKNILRGYNEPSTGKYGILLSSSKNRKRLLEVLILKEVLSMNPDLKLQINTFKSGVEIQFPAPETLEKNTHVIDPEVAKYFYEINDYYSAFQHQFNEAYSKLEGN